MVQTQATLIEKATMAPAWWRFTLTAPDMPPPLPGQFLLLRCADRYSCYLRRPVFPVPLSPHHFTLLLRPDPDPGLAWLSARQPGDTLDIIGPLGIGFPLPKGTRHLLLVSDTPDIGPLLGQMERALAAGLAVTLALGGSRASRLYPVAALPPVVEFHAATLDGSLGHRGAVTDLLPDLLRWADLTCAAGSPALYRILRQQMEQVRVRAEANFLYILNAAAWFACGMGACLSCQVNTDTGSKLACVDGPVFDVAKLTLEL